MKSEVKAEVKTEVKCEVKADIKPEVKADNVKRRNVKRPKTDSFGDGGRIAKFMGNPNAERARLEIKHQTHLPSNKKSAEPEKTHKLGEMSGLSRDVEVSNLRSVAAQQALALRLSGADAYTNEKQDQGDSHQAAT